jgi:hypothetical protein
MSSNLIDALILMNFFTLCIIIVVIYLKWTIKKN